MALEIIGVAHRIFLPEGRPSLKQWKPPQLPVTPPSLKPIRINHLSHFSMALRLCETPIVDLVK